MKFRYVIFRRWKNAGKLILLDKAILQTFKPLKVALCCSYDGVPLKYKKKNGRAFSLPARLFELTQH
jgi:hypothetical protein